VTAGGERTAVYAGINARRIFVSVLLLSGALGGLTGVVLMIDQVQSFSSPLHSGNEGYIGVVVALIAGNSILGAIPAGWLMAFVAAAAISLQISGVSPSVVLFVTGMLLVIASTADAIARYRLRLGTTAPDGGSERTLEERP
jgi:general nucleoside transport system permease protein